MSSSLQQIDFNGRFEYSNILEVEITPVEFSLSQNYPNPFNPVTIIRWQSPISSQQTIKVFDVVGNEIAILVDEFRQAGRYEVVFDASELSSGIYFFQLESGDFIQAKKMILMR